MSQCLSIEELRASMPKGGLFRGECPWLLSPQPLSLTKKEVKEMQSLGYLLGKFYDACQSIYHASAEGKEHGWVAKLLDAGKPDWLVNLQRTKAMKQATARVIRPDLMATDQGWIVSELDSIPGGQGVTCFLSRLYADAGWDVIGGRDGMVEGFRESHPNETRILVSRESDDYRAEMEYFANCLGEDYSCEDAELVGRTIPEGSSWYRFFELFDTDQIPSSRELLEAAAEKRACVSPPPVAHLEEKLWLALFHSPGLQKTWKKLLRGSHWERLDRLIPHGWVLEPTELPPHAALPWLNVHGWDDVAQMSQRERRLVLKISGFNSLAWGARGVLMGHDMSSEDWSNALQNAMSQREYSPWMVQEFHAGKIIEHPYYERDTNILKMMRGRVRLCPYYYRLSDGKTHLGGCLATIVPEDKKKIHGMKDGIMVPCCLEEKMKLI
ncbi:MAG: hypothetical protein RRY13_04800 [Akkermansia sp.]